MHVLQPDDADIAAGVKRIALARLDAALAALGNGALPVDRKARLGRTHLKKVRGLLRLVRPILPDHPAQNLALRDAGRIVVDLCDSVEMVTAIDRFADLLIDGLGHDAAVSLRAAIAQQAEKRLRGDDVPDLLQRFQIALLSARERVLDWPTIMDRDALERALAKTHRRADRAVALAVTDATPQRLHVWRTQTAYHRTHVRLLRVTMPGPMEAHLALADALLDGLADTRDATLLDAILSQQDGAVPDDALAKARLALSEEQDRLRPILFDIGAALMADTPDSFARRVAIYYDIWRSGRLIPSD
ncbi:hypothetical protein PARPLA_00624 [Rhodobacteraceae bacterium THAF1]|uniref:CHAD domain-containing protein n=1 Tax=Palleronia sp. THAF1 TaxID=2587842 RepID=UPI000F3B2214|nr:CHAD domain-containing protein [Palleronia sp. THAF1]QFU09813.1 hypothetical protein FIU81_14140 [Palleronia sp. THAF1]VDC17284.1 hypothetical protein PARPLA_00624 [Rhodobacteraceae bacterium THAF1]